MVGITKIKLGLLFMTSSVLIACRENQTMDFSKQHLIEDNFLEIIDTNAYKYGSFRPLPPLPNTKEKLCYFPQLLIQLKKEVTSDKYMESEINYYFKKDKSLENKFLPLLEKQAYVYFNIDSTFPKKIGRYHIAFNVDTTNVKIKYAGEVSFKNFKINSKVGYFVLEKSSNNSSIGYILVLERIRNKWCVIRRDVLYQSKG